MFDPKDKSTSTSIMKIQDGKDGKPGEDGNDGTKILNGNEKPTVLQGVIGDFYIDTYSGTLYKKVSETGNADTDWAPQCILKGQNGHSPIKNVDYFDGKDGLKIVTHDGSPVGTLKVTDYQDGDLILDTTTPNEKGSIMYYLWQKQGNAWVDLGHLKGNPGEPGIPGEKGDTGSYVKASLKTIDSQTVSLVMEQSSYYCLINPNIKSISLSLGPVEEGTLGEFMCEFSIRNGNTKPSINLSGIPYANGWIAEDFEPGYKYVIYILNNIAYVTYAPLGV
jgi:hypothetical protein